MLATEDSAVSCGVHQAYGLERSTPQKLTMALADSYFQECNDWKCDEYGTYGEGVACRHRNEAINCAHFIFSDVMRNNTGNGARLAAFLTKLDIGTVVESPTSRNPNSGNRIRVWIFTPDRRKFYNWAREQNEKAAPKKRVATATAGRIPVRRRRRR